MRRLIGAVLSATVFGSVAVQPVLANGGSQVLMNREVVKAASANDSLAAKSAVAKCPPNKVVIGGGAEVNSNSSISVTRSLPMTHLGEGWIAEAIEIAPFTFNWVVTAWAICADQR